MEWELSRGWEQKGEMEGEIPPTFLAEEEFSFPSTSTCTS